MVYMRQLKGYETPGKEHHVCHLNQVIYGLKQSGREWYNMLCGIMQQFGLMHCKTKHAVFHKHNDNDTLIITVDVDNLTMAGNTKTVIHKFKDKLRTILRIKDFGDLHWLLGIKVECNHKLHMISFSQHPYIEKIIKRFGLQDANPLSTPLDPHHKHTLSQSPSTACQFNDMCNMSFRETTGSLMYAALDTCLDISFGVSFLAQFKQNTGRPHWEVVKQVLHYLKGTKVTRLIIGGS